MGSSVGLVFIALRRRAPVASFLLLIALCLVIPAQSGAAPSASLTAGFAAGTRLGEATTLTTTLNLTGSEYHGHPLPLTQVTLRTPPGTVLAEGGFPRCEPLLLKNLGPPGCPAGSNFWAVGSLTGFVAFGEEYLEEQGATVELFFDSEGGTVALLHGSNPASYELIATGEYLPAEGGTGPGFRLSIPPIETVVGGPVASITSLTIPLGAFYEHGGVTAASVTAPKECTIDLTWSVSAKLSNGEGTEATTSADTTSGCPAIGKSQEEAVVAKKASEEAQARKAAEEAAAKKTAEEERHATVKIDKVKVSTARVLVTVRLTHAGTVTITGTGLKKTVVSLAAGTHQIPVALSAAGKAERKHGKRIKLAASLKMSARTVKSSEKVRL